MWSTLVRALSLLTDAPESPKVIDSFIGARF